MLSCFLFNSLHIGINVKRCLGVIEYNLYNWCNNILEQIVIIFGFDRLIKIGIFYPQLHAKTLIESNKRRIDQ